MKECLDEGMIQAYVDGELSPETAGEVATHAGVCTTCAAALSEAENELSLLAVAFEPELSLPVPSERLRERLDTAVGELRAQSVVPERGSTWGFKGWLASLVPSFNFVPRHAVGFASLIAVVAFAAIFAVVGLRRDGNQDYLAVVGGNNGMKLPEFTEPRNPSPSPTPIIRDHDHSNVPVNYTRPNPVRPVVKTLDQPLPGEGSYLKTIASLTSIVENNGDNALKPSMRADYERNLALVDHAIDATRRTARRNPKDPDAADFLYSSYQSKIDLLSTVAEQGQMVAVVR